MGEEKKKSGFWKDFKDFISKGNVIDLAVAVVIGAAFNKIVSSFVNDIIMPLISLIVGGKSVADWKWVITEEVVKDGSVVTAESALRYGQFIQNVIDFLIVAFTIFVVLRAFTKLQKRRQKKDADAEEEKKDA
ncbi:MAG: large conductance mechanosensitive channel protein MscL [Clostridia bacterium]|nr:large conductance mechanosensitive channel protein MscL [Clostridia bacterium]